jgi:hypothetical protein
MWIMRRWAGRPLMGIFPVVILSAFLFAGCTKVTGGGWIDSASPVPGERATFGFSAKCKDTMKNGAPVAVLDEGQFEYDDHAANALVRIHGDVEPIEFHPGVTCKQLASEPDLLGIGEFVGTYRTQPQVVPARQGTFTVVAVDGGEGGSVVDGDELTVILDGDITYFNFGVVQGGNLQVQ